MKFTKEKIVGIVGAAVGLIGMFLPFISRSVYSIIKVDLTYMKEFSPDNIIYIGFIAVALVALFINKLKKPRLLFPAAAIGLVLYDGFVNLNSDAAKTIKAAGGTTSLGIGFYVMIVGAAAVLVAILMAPKEAKEIKSGYNPDNSYNPANTNGGTTYSYGNNINNPIPEPTPSTQTNSWTQPNEPVNNPFVQANQPVEPVQPAQPTYEQPTQPVVEPVQPAQPTYEQPTQPVVEPVQPTQPTYEQPVEPAVEETNRFISSTPEETTNPNGQDNSNGTNIFYS